MVWDGRYSYILYSGVSQFPKSYLHNTGKLKWIGRVWRTNPLFFASACKSIFAKIVDMSQKLILNSAQKY